MHVIAFIVACLVSFRALFSQNERLKPNKPAARPAAPERQSEKQSKDFEGGGSGSKPSAGGYHSGGSTAVGQGSSNASRGALNNIFQKNRFRVFQDSLLDTCRTLEGLDDDALVEMDPLATVDHERMDVALERGQIGGFQNMAHGPGQTIPVRSSHDSLENLNHEGAERAGECDSQGVSALGEEEPEFNATKNDVPRRRDTVLSHASQLSLDSLYMSRGDRPSVDTQRGR